MLRAVCLTRETLAFSLESAEANKNHQIGADEYLKR